ncbi:MAG TPA: DinB family protein [Candidatus Limnocylindria bacterium]|nr:DinB family protein [Candidatus Limnocylindria bacterium]
MAHAGAALDDFLLRHAPRTPEPVDAALLDARRSLSQALTVLGSVNDESLERPWTWRGGEADIRYGFYRQLEALQEARARTRPLLAAALAHDPPARPLVAMASAARWDLHGLVAGLSEADLDADPGGDEWTVRQTLAHICGGQRAYGWFTSWWLAQRDLRGEALPQRVPDELAELLPEEETEGVGSLADIGRRLDDILDLSAGALAGLDDAALAEGARWSGVPVTIGFRIGRWSSHIREHTVQLEKTLAMLGRQPGEVDRLLRLIAGAYGRLEEELYCWPASETGPAEAAELVAAVAQDVVRGAREVAAAAAA